MTLNGEGTRSAEGLPAILRSELFGGLRKNPGFFSEIALSQNGAANMTKSKRDMGENQTESKVDSQAGGPGTPQAKNSQRELPDLLESFTRLERPLDRPRAELGHSLSDP